MKAEEIQRNLRRGLILKLNTSARPRPFAARVTAQQPKVLFFCLLGAIAVSALLLFLN